MEKILVHSECHSYCTSANNKIFFLVQYSNANHIDTKMVIYFFVKTIIYQHIIA
jgi:hypothetical protein